MQKDTAQKQTNQRCGCLKCFATFKSKVVTKGDSLD